MTAVLVGRFTPGSEEWRDARRLRIGGSEIASVVGLAPPTWDSRFSLWHRKQGLVGPKPQNEEMEWGSRLEPAVLQKFFEQPGRRRLDEGGSYVHPDRPWQLATPDAFLDTGSESELVEAKTSPQDGPEWGIPGTDQVPVHIRCQVLWQLDVLDLQVCHIPVLIGGCRYREYVIRIDDAARSEIKHLRREGETFIASIEANERPPIDGHDQTYQVLRESHPLIDVGVEHELDEELALAYLETKDALHAAEQAHKTRRSQVFDILGTANYGIYRDTRIVRRQANGDGLPFLASTRKDPRPKEETE